MAIEDPDRDLVRSCQDSGSEGFEPAFSRLYGLYKDRVFNIAWRVTGDPVEAMDVCQETFTLLLRKIGTFQFESKFSSWLYRIVVNTSIDSKRRSQSRNRREHGFPVFHDGSAPLEMEDDKVAGPDRSVLSREEADLVHAAIQKLSAKLRAITVLRYMQGLAYEELAEVLQLSLGTVKSRLARAHLALARHLGPILEPGRPGGEETRTETGEPEKAENCLQDDDLG